MAHFFHRWIRKKEGTTAVEFALVGIPFVLMIIGTVEMAVMFTAQSVLHESTFTAARLIRTGQIQGGGMGDGEQAFRQSVCDFASLLIPCERIQFQVRQIPTFSDAQDQDLEFDEDGNLEDQDFDPGGVSEIVLVRVVYNYPIITPFMQPFLGQNGGMTRMMVSTIVLQNEPYQFEEE
jgi:Flp pilus assembly protein TadG